MVVLLANTNSPFNPLPRREGREEGDVFNIFTKASILLSETTHNLKSINHIDIKNRHKTTGEAACRQDLFYLDFWRNLEEFLILTGGSYRGNTTGSGPVNRGSNPRPPANLWSHRLAVQDTGLSRRRHGFESRWDYQEIHNPLIFFNRIKGFFF